MSTPLYNSELSLALHTIHTASLLTKRVLHSLQNNVAAETKADDSPVTIADFAAQALIISALHAVYPSDTFLGEESADQLRQNEHLAERVWALVQHAKELVNVGPAGVAASSDVQHVQEDGREVAAAAAARGELTFPASKNEMLDVIDLGTSKQTNQGRVWVMDPVDGTATFMTGNQYAVCLCLLVNGVQQVAVIGCPNLAFDVHASRQRIREETVDEAGYGVVLSAIRGHGTFVRSMRADGLGEAVKVEHGEQKTAAAAPATTASLHALDFVESTLGKTSLSQPEHRAVAELLGATWPGTVLWSQQMKYVALALGATDVMLRIPKGKERYTYVWDHAGGNLLFQEAGGVIRDFDGKVIDFSQGRLITGTNNHGMIATLPWAFADVDRAVKEVLGRRSR